MPRSLLKASLQCSRTKNLAFTKGNLCSQEDRIVFD